MIQSAKGGKAMIVNTSRLEEESSSINRQSAQIAQISDELGRLTGGLDDGGGMELIKIHLRHIVKNLETEARKAKLLSDLLGRISGRYARTEREVADTETVQVPPSAETVRAETRLVEERPPQTPDIDEIARRNAEILEKLREVNRIRPTVIGENRPAWMAAICKTFGKAEKGDDEK